VKVGKNHNLNFVLTFYMAAKHEYERVKKAYKIQAAEMKFLGSVRRCIKLANIRMKKYGGMKQ
jgi:hypothetical protein